jgi:hypothetical protein
MSPRRPALAASAPVLVFGLALTLVACSPSAPSSPGLTSATTPVPTAAATVSAGTLEPGASPTPTPVAGTSACNPASLAAEITSWQGATGHRIATVTVTNNGKSTCTIHALATPQLVDANGTILIQGQPPTSATTLTLAYYDVVTTMVSDGNYCGPAPVEPVTVAFVFPGGEGRIVAKPAADNSLGGVPPCNGPAGSAGDIEMQPFAR